MCIPAPFMSCQYNVFSFLVLLKLKTSKMSVPCAQHLDLELPKIDSSTPVLHNHLVYIFRTIDVTVKYIWFFINFFFIKKSFCLVGIAQKGQGHPPLATRHFSPSNFMTINILRPSNLFFTHHSQLATRYFFLREGDTGF